MSSHAPGEGGKNAPVQITEGPSTVARFERSRVVIAIPRGIPWCRRVICSSFAFSRLHILTDSPLPENSRGRFV